MMKKLLRAAMIAEINLINHAFDRAREIKPNALITGATEAPERKSTAVWRPVH
jgi:hypothetical protein